MFHMSNLIARLIVILIIHLSEYSRQLSALIATLYSQCAMRHGIEYYFPYQISVSGIVLCIMTDKKRLIAFFQININAEYHGRMDWSSYIVWHSTNGLCHPIYRHRKYQIIQNRYIYFLCNIDKGLSVTK